MFFFSMTTSSTGSNQRIVLWVVFILWARLQRHTVSTDVIWSWTWLLSTSSLTSGDPLLLTPQPGLCTQRNIWKATQIKRARANTVCACDSGTGGHVSFHRLSWTLTSISTPPPHTHTHPTHTPQRLISSQTGCEYLLSNLAALHPRRARNVKGLPESTHRYRVGTFASRDRRFISFMSGLDGIS